MTPTLDVTSFEWKTNGREDDEGGVKALLISTLQIGSALFHVEAYQVEMRDGVQTALQYEEDVALIAEGVHADGTWYTVEIEGRPYVLIATPFCN